MNKTITSVALALAVLTVLSYGTHAYAQNATSTGVTRDHDRNHFFGPGLGIGARLNLGLPFVREHDHLNIGGSTVVVPPAPTVATTPVVRDHEHDFALTRSHDFARFHDFAFAHRDHFIFLNGQYVVLPQAVGCPAGSQLDVATGECVIVQQAIIAQAAPTILSESVQVPTVTEQQTVVQGQSEVVGQPVVTCPQGNLVNGQCVVETQSQSVVAPNVSCAVGNLVNGQCVEQQQQIVVGQSCGCPEGSQTVNGQCIVNALPSQVTVGTTPGEIIILGHHFHHEGDLPFLR